MKKGVFIFFTLFLSITWSLRVCGSDWKIYNQSKVNPRYYDTESIIRQKDGTVRIWCKKVLDNWEISYLYELNCGNRTYRNLESIKRERRDATHKNMDSNEMPGKEESEPKVATFEVDPKTYNALKAYKDAGDYKSYMDLWNRFQRGEIVSNIEPDSDMERLFKIICK